LDAREDDTSRLVGVHGGAREGRRERERGEEREEENNKTEQVLLKKERVRLRIETKERMRERRGKIVIWEGKRTKGE
jgi:hypothetical protein